MTETAGITAIWQTGWGRLAECKRRDLPPQLFFPRPKQTIDPRVFSACSACRVRRQCLTAALRLERATALGGRILRYGVWGGLTKQRSGRRPNRHH